MLLVWQAPTNQPSTQPEPGSEGRLHCIRQLEKQILSSETRPTASQSDSGITALRVALSAGLIALVSPTLADPDLWGHVRFGLDMLRDRALVRSDPYSFTSDVPWVNHEWLAEVVMGSAYAIAGAPGLAALKLALVVLTGLVIARTLRRSGVPMLVREFWLGVAVVGGSGITLTLRPQLFSLLCCALLLSWLVEHRERIAHGWIPPVIFLWWANLHGGFLVGLGLLGTWVGWALVTRAPTAGRWLAIGAASLAATLLTPEGPGLWRFLLETVRLGRVNIVEWQPLTAFPIWFAIPWVGTVALLGVSWGRQRAITPGHLASLLLLVASARVVRLVPFALLTTIVCVAPTFTRGTLRIASTPRRGIAVLVVVAVLAVVASTARIRSQWGCLPITDIDQEGAISLRASAGRVLTWFTWGEYAIWWLPTWRVSLDGRRETVYSPDVLARHDAIYRGTPGWTDALQQLAPDAIWLPKTLPTIPAIRSLGWSHAVETTQGIVLSRAPLPAVTAPVSVCFPGGPVH